MDDIDFGAATGPSPEDMGGQTPPKRISTQEEAQRLSPGSSFIGPDDKERVVPFHVERPEQLQHVPDGADFIGPDGKLRQKPHYQGVDYTAQTLYDMGVNDKERKKALERSYPGKVRDDPSGGFFVEDDDGVMRKPGRGLQRYTGGASAAAVPTILSVLGALGGGVAGSEAPIVGNVAGAAAGGAGGAILGQQFNDLILTLAGTIDRTPTERFVASGEAALGGMAGAGVGRGVAMAVPSLKTGVSALSAAAPSIARSFLGAGEADLKMARELTEKGVLVPPSAWAKEAPHLQNVVEVFDPAFHTQKPLLESATAHYEKNAGALLEALGVKDPGSLTKPIADVPTKEAGEALPRILQKTRGEMADADAKMQAALTQRRAEVQAGQPAADAQRETVLQAAEQSRFAAQKLIDAGYKDIEGDISTAMKVAKAGHNSGDLWGAVGQKLVALRRGVGTRATQMYDAADQAAGGHLPNIEGLPNTAEQFLNQLPPDFQNRYPDMVRKLRDLAGVKDEKGEWIKEPVNPTFGQLHDIRSQFRQNVNYYDLAPDVREGTYKFFAGKVDKILHGINEVEAPVQPTAAFAIKDATEASAPAPGTVRLYRGGGPPSEVGGGARWVTTDRKYAEGYTTPGMAWTPKTGSYLQYADIPETDMRVKMPAGQTTHSFEAPEDIASQLRPFYQKKGAQGGSERATALKEASVLLNAADKFYSDNIKIFNSQQVKAVMRGLEAGEPADPQNLYNVIVRSGQSDLTNKLKEMVGSPLWAGVKAADTQAMLDASKTLTPGVVDGKKFAREVLDRVRDGTLELVHGDQAGKLREQALRIEQLAGREPIPVRPGDTPTQVIARARQAQEVAKATAKADPLTTLNREMKKVQVDHARELARMKAEQRNDPLGFLYDPTTGATEAVNRILDNEDLTLAAAVRFGEKSPEFEQMRQIWAQRFLTGTMKPSEGLTKVSPEIQALMFPGVSLSQMQTLAKEMDFLLDTRAGKGTAAGMAAMSAVEHPWGGGFMGKTVQKALKVTGPLADTTARSMRSAYYAAIRKFMTSPATMRWLEKGLNGSPADREAVRRSIQGVLQKGGAVGAGLGEAVTQSAGPP